MQGGGLGFDLGFQAALCVQQCAVLLQDGFFFFGRVVFQRGFEVGFGDFAFVVLRNSE